MIVNFSTYRPHPWHGIDPGPDAPEIVHAFIEITPFDPVKWEIDKASGYLKVDRPQRTNSLPPTLYGFIPQTYCGSRVAELAGTEVGDGDPLDICVLSERPINRADILLTARTVGGLLMTDHGEADDKIIAVLDQDAEWGQATDIGEIPAWMVERIRHYFMTYKLKPTQSDPEVIVGEAYGPDHARTVINAALADYDELMAQHTAENGGRPGA